MAWAIITIYISKCAQMNPQQPPKTSKFYSKCKMCDIEKTLGGWVPPPLVARRLSILGLFYFLLLFFSLSFSSISVLTMRLLQDSSRPLFLVASLITVKSTLFSFRSSLTLSIKIFLCLPLLLLKFLFYFKYWQVVRVNFIISVLY